MQFSRTDIDALNVVVKLTVEPQDYQEKVEKQLKEIRRRADIPGFRKGMVPLGLVRKMYGKGVLAEQINSVLSEGIYNYVREQNLNILGEPLPNEQETDEIDFDNNTTFTFGFDLGLAPAFDAKLSEKDKIVYYEIEVTDKMVDDQVESYANRFGKQEDVEVYSDGDLLRGTITEQVENGIVNENAVFSPEYMKSDAQKKLFEGAKVGDVVTFNPMEAYESEIEVSSILGIEKEKVAEHKGDFTFTISSIGHFVPAALEAVLFATVFGDKAPADLEGFRQLVREEMKQNLKQDQDYRFNLDAKEVILGKVGELQFPVDFLKRWLKATNKDMTDETIEKELPQMLEELRWQLAKDQLAKEYKVEVKDEDMLEYAKNVVRMQYMQYGMSHIEDNYLVDFAQRLLKDENQARAIYQRAEEQNILAAVKGVVKLDVKSISYDDFGKLFEQKK